MGNFTKKAASGVLSITTAVWLSGAMMFVPVASAQSTADLQAQITALLAQIQALQAQLSATPSTPAASVSCSFSRSLTVGSKGMDVKCLQQFLNGAGHQVSASGAGSPGNETDTFGSLTRAAVAKWQAANNVSPAVGYFGSLSQAKYSAVVAAVPTTPTTPTTP